MINSPINHADAMKILKDLGINPEKIKDESIFFAARIFTVMRDYGLIRIVDGKVHSYN